jgi:type IV secretory pathway protease TraF
VNRLLITLITTASAATVLLLTIGWRLIPRLVASESVPIGLYRVQPAGKLAVTDLVVAMPPDPLATFLADAGYLAHRVPLIKRILALASQTVCRTGLIITVDGVEVGMARDRDSRRSLAAQLARLRGHRQQ